MIILNNLTLNDWLYCNEHSYPIMCDEFVQDYFGSHKELPKQIKIELSKRKFKSSRLVKLKNFQWFDENAGYYRPILWNLVAVLKSMNCTTHVYIRITPITGTKPASQSVPNTP